MNDHMIPHDDDSRIEVGIERKDQFGGRALERKAETAAVAVAAQARAAVEARYTMALHRPRDMDNARAKMLKACKRPGFAASARYAIPRGGKTIEGFSIRFAEETIRDMGNLLPEVTTVYDDERQRIVRVALTDLESNITYTKDVVVAKTVERTQPKPGQKIISTRLNSEGRPVHTVATTDDDLLAKETALVSKSLRNHALRLVPGDILDDCLRQIAATRLDDAAADPDAKRKEVADAFAGLNVMPAQLKEFLGVDLGAASPAQIAELRGLFVAIRDGESTWADVMAERQQAAAESAPAAPSGDTKAPPKNLGEVKARAKKIVVRDENGAELDYDVPPGEPPAPMKVP